MSNARFLADIPTLAEAKGDIIAATADNAFDVLSVGTEGQILTVDSSTATGLAWENKEVTVSQITDLTATATELNILDGATLSTTELNYLDGVTSSVQDQINNIPPSKILQVVSTHYTGTASSSSATPVNVSGFSATITPASASSNILVIVHTQFGFDSNDPYPYILLTRNGTSIGTGTSATGVQINTFLSGPSVPGAGDGKTVYKYIPASKTFLDSPNSTSSLTYQIQLAQPFSGVAYLNRTSFIGNQVYVQYPSSTITLMEITS